MQSHEQYGYRMRMRGASPDPDNDDVDDGPSLDDSSARCNTCESQRFPGDPELPNLPFIYYVGNQYSVLQYSHDAYGYITRRNDTKNGQQEDYTYDTLGRLTSFTVNDTLTRSFTYSANGLQCDRAVLATAGGATSTTLFISDDCEYETTPAFSHHIDHIRADGKTVALHVYNTTVGTDSVYYVQTDLLGSWERVVKANKSVVLSCHFDPWGNRMDADSWVVHHPDSVFQFRRGFTGHEHYDRFGIINMNARLYDPVIARFFSPDPQVQSPFSTQGLNRYSYCGNNPVMNTDPDGEFIFTLMLIGGIINYHIHKEQGDVHNFKDGLAYWFQGAIGGMTYALSPSVYSGLGLLSTTLSMIRNPQNAWRIFAGQFYFDEQTGHGFLQSFTRFTWEYPQTYIGYNYTQFRNLGDVDRVDYFGGATFATNENADNHQGVTLGNYINIDMKGSIYKPFKEWLLQNDQMYLHEYGHSIQSNILGVAYLLAIGVPSLGSGIRADIDDSYSHSYFFTELWANRLGNRYFNGYYEYIWRNYQDYPLHNN